MIPVYWRGRKVGEAEITGRQLVDINLSDEECRKHVIDPGGGGSVSMSIGFRPGSGSATELTINDAPVSQRGPCSICGHWPCTCGEPL